VALCGRSASIVTDGAAGQPGGAAYSRNVTTPRSTPVRYAREAGPGDSGGRVSLRRVLPGGGYGDLLGELLSWEAGTVRVSTRDGVVHEVAEDAVVAVRRVPAPPERRVRG
jgi:hypothetical protein